MHELLNIASDWSAWSRPFPASTLRQVPWPEALSSKLALVIQGVRRCGKSTLMTQMIEHYRLDPERCLFINFEDPRLSQLLHYQTLDELVIAFRAHHGDKAPLHFFFDEVQWVDGWQKWLRAKLDQPGNDTFTVTGSNASLLSGELGSTLTGRYLKIELFPFSYPEWRTLKPKQSLSHWLKQGGFPEPAKSKNADRLLQQYLQDIVERDVRERIGGRSSLAIRQLVQMVFESAGSELSLRRIAGARGIAVETAAAWLEACENAYLLFPCPWFAWSERKRASRNVKYYPVDTGLRRVAVTGAGADQGKMLECATYLALRQRYSDVFYWRDSAGEVDFVVLDGNQPIPIQVTWDEVRERHHRATERFYESFPQAGEGWVVTAENFADTF